MTLPYSRVFGFLQTHDWTGSFLPVFVQLFGSVSLLCTLLILPEWHPINLFFF